MEQTTSMRNSFIRGLPVLCERCQKPVEFCYQPGTLCENCLATEVYEKSGLHAFCMHTQFKPPLTRKTIEDTDDYEKQQLSAYRVSTERQSRVCRRKATRDKRGGPSREG